MGDALLGLFLYPTSTAALVMFDCLSETQPEGVPVERFAKLVSDLQQTGQLPARQQVRVDDRGKNSLGLARSWYLEPDVREFETEEIVRELVAAAAAGRSEAEARFQARLAPPEGTHLSAPMTGAGEAAAPV